MHEIQDLGEELVGFSAGQLAELDLPERLLDAIVLAQSITKFGARRRQLQYIGRLMREVDTAPIAARLDKWAGRSREAVAYLHMMERWRARLLESDAAVTELAIAYPGRDLQRLRTLVRNARHASANRQPPSQLRSYRELFQELRSIVPEQPSKTSKRSRVQAFTTEDTENTEETKSEMDSCQRQAIEGNVRSELCLCQDVLSFLRVHRGEKL